MEFSCSLHMVNLNFYEINRNQRECKYFWEELLRNVGTAGFNTIELPYDPYWQFGGRNGIPFNRYCIENSYGFLKEFQSFLADCGIEKISNLYFDPRFLESSDLNAYFGAYEHFIRLEIEEAAELKTQDVVVSVSEEIGHLKTVGKNFEEFKKIYQDKTVVALKNAIGYAKENNVSLSIKNEFWGIGRGNEIEYYLTQLPELKYAPDLAHLDIAQVDIDAFFEKYFDRMNVVIFSDTNYTDTECCYSEPSPEYPAKGENQLVYCDLGQGHVNLKKHFQKLEALGYKGNLVCECKQTQDYCRALLRMKRVTDDFGKR